MAGLAFNLGNTFWVRILLDVGVASVASKAAVNACAEFVSVDRDAMARRILHRLVAVTGEAVSLRRKDARVGKHQDQCKD